MANTQTYEFTKAELAEFALSVLGWYAKQVHFNEPYAKNEAELYQVIDEMCDGYNSNWIACFTISKIPLCADMASMFVNMRENREKEGTNE